MGARYPLGPKPWRDSSPPLPGQWENFPLVNKTNRGRWVEAPGTGWVALPSTSAFVFPGGRSWKLLRGLESRLWVSSSHLDHLIWLTERHGLLVLATALLFLEKRL